MVRSSIASDFLEHEARGPSRELYDDTYPTYGRLAVEEVGDQYDVLVVDEAQDLLRPHILDVLDIWLKGGLSAGRWAVFGDFQRQAIFAAQSADQLKEALSERAVQYARGRLTLNCRNTRNIGEETALLSGFQSPPYRMGQVVGPPVDYHFYRSPGGEAAIVVEQVRSFFRGGVKADDIVILSRLRLEHSGVAGIDGGSVFTLLDVSDRDPRGSRPPVIRFATCQAFKGMESPVVILCDVEQVSEGEPQSLLYVAMSRASSQLVVLAHEGARASIAECVRRKLEEGWNAGQ
jgi:superfamily I DNA/RNA helicase